MLVCVGQCVSLHGQLRRSFVDQIVYIRCLMDARLMRRNQESIRTQTNNHNAKPINRQRQTHLPQQPRPPLPPRLRIRNTLQEPTPLHTTRLIIRLVIIFLHQPLMMWRLRVRDFVVKQTGQDEANGCAARAADISEDFLEGGDGHGDNVGENDDDGGEESET